MDAGRVLAAVPFDELGRLVPKLGETRERVAANDPAAGQASLQPRACRVEHAWREHFYRPGKGYGRRADGL